MRSSTDVAVLTWDYARPKGGLGRLLQGMVRILRTAGCTVTVAAPAISHPDDVHLLDSTACLPGGHLVFSLLLASRLRAILHRRRPRLLLTAAGPGGLFLLPRPKTVRLCVVVAHTYRQQARAVPGQWWKRAFVPLEQRTYRMAQRLLCLCGDTQRVLTEEYGVDASRIALVVPAIDVDTWGGQGVVKEEGLCVCVARLERRKGVTVLLRAWLDVLARVPTARLVIVGDGWERRRIDRQMKFLGSSVIRQPSLSQRELALLVRRAQVAVCPSYLEGFGLSAAEAMAAGTAVVATDVDGLRSLIRHGETGWLVPPRDPLLLADAIVRLLRDRGLRHRLARAAQGECRRRFDPTDADASLVRAIGCV